MELTKNDLGHLHDVILDALDIDLDSDEKIIEYRNKLPTDIQLDIEKWGVSDTVVRDNIYVWLLKNIKNN